MKKNGLNHFIPLIALSAWAFHEAFAFNNDTPLSELVMINGVASFQGCALRDTQDHRERARLILLSIMAEAKNAQTTGHERVTNENMQVSIREQSKVFIPPQVIFYREIVVNSDRYTCAYAAK